MLILNQQEQLEHIKFALKHYGTNTQGEEYRQGQVAEHILEIFNTIIEVYDATKEIDTELTINFTVR